MLYYAGAFLVLAILAGLFGFGIVGAAAVGIAKFLFWFFAVCFVLSILFYGVGRHK